MFEDKSYEKLMEEALKRVDDTLDKREGSVIYDAIAPCLYEIAGLYIQMDNLLNMTFAESATEDFLDKRVNEMGLERNPGTKAKLSVELLGDIPEGTRFYTGDIFFTYKGNMAINEGDIDYVECDKIGLAGNITSGDLTIIDENENFTSCKITGIISYGTERETDEELRTRYFDYVSNPPMSGNVADYKKALDNYEDDFSYHIVPVWENDEGFVKVYIDNENLVDKVQEYLDPGSEGLGLGVAPIGSRVYVYCAPAFSVNVTCDVTCESEDMTTEIFSAISQFFNDFTFGNSEINYYELGMKILDVKNVVSLNNLILTIGNRDYMGNVNLPDNYTIPFLDESSEINVTVI